MALSKDRYWEIDRHYYSKARAVLDEARNHLQKYNYDLCARRAQEAFELFLKMIFLLIEKEYPKVHDISNEIYKVHTFLKEFKFSDQRVAQIVLRNKTLGLWRNPSFYGDEKLKVSGIFGQNEARVALQYAEEMDSDCFRLKSEIIRRLS